MCGIAGIIRITPPVAPHLARAAQAPIATSAALARTPEQAIQEAWLDTLDDAIKHRGPDGAGRFRDRAIRADGAIVDVALVHRRMAIIDLACGHQPMVSLGRGQGVITETKRFSLGDGLGLYEPGEYGIQLSRAALAAGGGVRTVEQDGSSHTQPDGLRHIGSDRVAVVFNGCIYNHRELRGQLLSAGHVFSTDHSDTEVLVHGWREWGESLFDRLEGMFAVAIWDAANTLFTIARDQFGEKPLHVACVYRDGSWHNFFASVPIESTALAAVIESSEVLLPSPTQLATWIRFGWGWRFPARGTHAIQPASGLMFDPHMDSYTNEEAGFDLRGAKPARGINFGILTSGGKAEVASRRDPLTVAQLDPLLKRAVLRRLESDVPLGCFLSGGIDSALIAHYAHEHLSTLRTFTVRMPDVAYDESEQAAAAARIIGAHHTTLECSARPAEDLVMLIRQIGLPFGDSSLLPAYWVSRAARREVKVALSGDGGDELFGGYDRYVWVHTLSRLPRNLAWLGTMLQKGALPKSRRSKAGRLLSAAAGDGYLDLLSIFPADAMKLLADPSSDELHRLFQEGQSRLPLFIQEFVMSFDLSYYLPHDLFRKTDSASMACALEVRCPFLDRDLATAALRAPAECLMPMNKRKGLLKELARKYFPSEIVDRPKMGFAIPIGEWFRTNFGGMRELLYDHLDAAEPFGNAMNITLNMNYVRQMLREHDQAGQKSIWPWKGRDHSQRLYMLLVLSIWCKWVASTQQHRA